MTVHGEKTEEEEVRKETQLLLEGFSAARENLIPILQAVQIKFGYIPTVAIKAIASFLALSSGEIFGVATFYTRFRFTPPGKHSIRVCLGTACHVKGGNIIMEEWERRIGIKEGGVTEDREFGLERVACVGCCALAPVVLVGKDVHGKMSPTAVEGILLRFTLEKEKQEEKT